MIEITGIDSIVPEVRVLLLTIRHTRELWKGTIEPPCEKNNKVSVRPDKTQISLGIRPVWSETSLSAWRKLEPLATHWAHSEGSD